MKFTVTNILYTLLTLFIIFNIGVLLQGIVRKIGARLGRRIGVPFYQGYIDIIKNYALRTSVHHGMMYFLGPVFRLTGGIGMLFFMPVIFGSEMFSNFSFSGDLILILYFMFFGTLGMALGAGESGHPYSPMGIGRGLSMMTAFEIPLTLAVIALAIQYHTFSISEIVAAQQGGITHWSLFTNPLAVTAAMLSLLGSSGRAPFNLVIAPQSIPIGPPTEFNSAFLGMLMTNRSIFPMAKMVLYANLFFGGATTWWEMILKIFFIYMWPVFIAVGFPRFRMAQALRWFVKYPMVIGILAIIFSRG